MAIDWLLVVEVFCICNNFKCVYINLCRIFLDSHVRLWSTVALLGSPEEVKESMLSTLTSHSGSVNVVRWSKDGKYLVSIFMFTFTSVSDVIHLIINLPFYNEYLIGFWI